MYNHKNLAASIAVISLLLPCSSWAQDAASSIPTITIVGITPLPGTGIDIDKVPGNTQSISARELSRDGAADLTGALNTQLSSVSINDTLADPFQPDILYRGFEASPLLGTPQGLAVYQNGVRINEAFGDTVNWDLFPEFAIDRVDVMSSNPVFGLNALGGSIVMTMKNGFTYEGGEATLSGGSFGQRAATVEYGQHWGPFGLYVAAKALDEDGWRLASPDSLRQFYSDLSFHQDKLQIDLSFTGANNRLFGQSVAPVQELAISRALVFTYPQDNFNQLEFVTLGGTYAVSDTLQLQSNFYYREYRQTVANGNTTDYTACTDPAEAGLLCQGDGLTTLTNAKGALVPDISNGGTIPIGENDLESIRAVGLGGSVQATYSQSLFGHTNQFVFGASIDHATVDFQTVTELGIVTPSIDVLPSDQFVVTPENSVDSNGDYTNSSPTSITATNNYYGIYATDTLDVTPELALTLSGRFNVAEIQIVDHMGTDLNGDNTYSRFNPAAGATYKILDNMTAYFGFSEANRAPSPSEIECSNPVQPCLFPTSLASDPPNLKQVVSHTYEGGLRGHFTLPGGLPGRFTWNASAFRTDVANDIYFASISASQGYAQNVGGTRRQGLEAAINYRDERWTVYANYSLVDATFESSFTLPSPTNPFADANGNIQVTTGDKLPAIPEHRVKFGVDYHVMPNWMIGGSLAYASSSYYRGDESNQNPQLPGYEVVTLHSTYDITEMFEIYANLQNAFDSRYSNFGQYGDPTGVNAPGVPTDGIGVDNRYQSPAPPIAAFGGVRVKF